MFLQILLGSVLMLATILIAGLSYWVMEACLGRLHRGLSREPHRSRRVATLAIASVWILVHLTAGVWLWALTLQGLGVFDTPETSVYFALVAFTTLGFGGILLPLEWRLLAGMAAAKGLLNMGLLTAVLVQALRQVRLNQLDWFKVRE